MASQQDSRPVKVTQAMRDVVSSVLAQELSYRGKGEEGPLLFSDSLTMLIHHETSRDDNEKPRTTISEFTDLLLDESMEEETIHEYVALNQHFAPQCNTHTNTMLLRGLHRPSRNREWMDPSDPISVQRTVILLQAIVLLRKSAREKLLGEALAYVDYGDNGHYDQSFRDAEVADLIMDNPELFETLIEMMVDRGYRDGIEIFREMLTHNTPALSNGVL